MSCQGSAICPKQLSKSQPKIIILMWWLTATVSFDLLRCAQKKKHSHAHTSALCLISKHLIVLCTVETKELLGSGSTFRGCAQVSCFHLFYTCSWVSEMWAISNGTACRGVSANARLSKTLWLIIFFFKTQCWKALWPEGSSVCGEVCSVKHHTPPVLPRLWTVRYLRSNWDLKHCPDCLRGWSLASVSGMLNPVTYHPLLTRTSLDHQAKAKVGIFGHFYLQASTSVPADDRTILEQKHMKTWQMNMNPALNTSLGNFITFGESKVLQRRSRRTDASPFYLCEVPEPLGGPRNSLTLLQPGSASSAIINEAFCVRQEGGRPQGSKLEKPLGGVAGELQHRDNQRVTLLDSL